MRYGTEHHADRSVEDVLQSRIRVLSAEVWDGRVRGIDVESWLSNFDGQVYPIDTERRHALNLLANFNFFNVATVRGLLKVMFRDLFRYRIIQETRTTMNGTCNFESLEREFQKELQATRFLGMGNPSESGAHLLYYFRQVNSLKKSLFIHQHEVLEKAVGSLHNRIAIPGLKRLIFIDDLMGSGTQAKEYSDKLLEHIVAAAQSDGQPLEIWYLTLFARPAAMNLIRQLPFKFVDTVHEIDDAEKAFSSDSRVYRSAPEGIDLQEAKAMITTYGRTLVPKHPLGYKDGQMLLGFEHNVPDNTLPIFWLNETARPWQAVFPRFDKDIS